MAMKPTLVVLAAGMGSRYGGLKQMDGMGPNGETVLDYSVFDAVRTNFGKIVFVIRRSFDEVFRKGIGSHFESEIQVEYAYQELDDLPEGFEVPVGREKPWGTGHAILCASSVVNEPFVVINADDFYGHDAFRKISDYLSANQERTGVSRYCMVGFYLKNTLTDHGHVARGVCIADGEGDLQSVNERAQIEKTASGIENKEPGNECRLSGEELVSMNFWGFTPAVFEQARSLFVDFLESKGQEMKSEFYIPMVVDQLIREGKATAHVLETNGAWFGVTYQADKPNVIASIKELIEAGKYPEKLWKS